MNPDPDRHAFVLMLLLRLCVQVTTEREKVSTTPVYLFAAGIPFVLVKMLPM